jgi:DNA invertase Pin-like site-specific DNA recombinase
MANRLTVHILAAVAEHEPGMIWARTKAALAAAKARGVRMGGFRGYRLSTNDCAKATTVKQGRARARAEQIAPLLTELRNTGVVTLPGIAAELNERSIPAPRGGVWHPATVRRLLRAGAA